MARAHMVSAVRPGHTAMAVRALGGGIRWFVLERPRRDTNGGSETEVTVTSKLQAKNVIAASRVRTDALR